MRITRRRAPCLDAGGACCESSAVTLIPSFAKAAHDYFANVAPALGRFLGIRNLQLDTRLTSLLAFIYTYHYLNWFIKAEVIRWNNMSRRRLALVAAASTASTALYFHDYSFSFTVLLAFSLAHIVLEFPLNALALRQLGAAIGAGRARPLRAHSSVFDVLFARGGRGRPPDPIIAANPLPNRHIPATEGRSRSSR
jgi:hypothetical protein